jgi:hypothetical protein
VQSFTLSYSSQVTSPLKSPNCPSRPRPLCSWCKALRTASTPCSSSCFSFSWSLSTIWISVSALNDLRICCGCFSV